MMNATEKKETLRNQSKKKFFLIGVAPFIVMNLLILAFIFIEMRSEAYKQLALTREYVRNQFLENFRDRIKDAHNLLESSAAVNLTPLISNVSADNMRRISKDLLSKTSAEKLTPAETALIWLKKFREINGYEEIFFVSHESQKINIALKNFHYIGHSLNSEDKELRILSAGYDHALQKKEVYLMDQSLLLPEKRAYIVLAVPVFDRAHKILGVFFLFYSADHFTELTAPARQGSESMEIYAVGQDYLFRSGSRFIGNAPMNEKALTTAAQQGLNHESGTAIAKDYRNTAVLSSFAHIRLNEELKLDFDWVLISEIDITEAFFSLFFLIIFILIITIALITFSRMISKNFAHEITEPLGRFSEIFRKMSVGEMTLYKQNYEKYAEFHYLSQAFTSLADTFSSIEYSIAELSRGNTAFETKENANHPIMHSINTMIQSLNKYSERAKEIADGNYNIEIHPRSSADRLGNSLLQMTSSLRLKQQSLEESEWQRNGRTVLAEIANESSDISKMAQAYILFFTEYLNGRSGLFYTVNPDSNNKELMLSASFGVPESYAPRQRISQNDGIVGSMLNSEAKIHLTDEPGENYFGFGTGLGESSRGFIITVPFLLQNMPLGAMEILFSEQVLSRSVKFINENSDIIASSLARMFEVSKTRTLLEKTSSQAEELQAQQEELRVINEELAEKNTVLEDQKKNIEKTNQSLEAMTHELALKADELQKTNRYKSQFLANVSHELRTPLNSLLLLSAKIEKNKDGNLTERQIQSLRIIHQSGNDLLALINGVLDLAKIEAGKIETNLADTSINAVANDIENTFRHSFEEKKIDFNISISSELPKEINTDPQKLIQILRNLLSNALKFTSQGKVETRFELSENRNQPFLLIAIRDTGAGIPNDKLELIFEAFQQADGSTSRIYGGTGLGLTISKEFIKQLSGYIEVESEVGKGSEFKVYIPFNKPAEKRDTRSFGSLTDKPPASELKAKLQPEFSSSASGKQQTVLIIEDDPKFAHILIDLSNSRGFRSLYASDGTAGLQIAETHKLDAIILDLKLPDLSGEEVLERLKGNKHTADIPVQIISGKSKADTLLQKGAIGYLKKPVSEEDIIHALENIQSIISESLGRILIIEPISELKNIMAAKYDERVIIDFVENPRQAMELLTRRDYNCMILDIDLKDFDPFDFFKKIKAIKESLPPVIIYTEKELSEEEHLRLNEYARFIVLKSGDSIRRLHDESMLFLTAVKRNAAQEKPQKQLSTASEKPRDALKILAIDDDMRSLFALCEELEDEGHSVTKAANGLFALKQLKESTQPFDLILTDIMMPEMDGYETMREIRKLKEYQKTPVIALTAKAMKGDRDLCLAAGATDYLAKPLNREKLIAMIKRLT
ncbi:MAG: response regulator [Spirochaetia bacterium]|nr:response regulator [Spirochaetia bacterium]